MGVVVESENPVLAPVYCRSACRQFPFVPVSEVFLFLLRPVFDGLLRPRLRAHRVGTQDAELLGK